MTEQMGLEDDTYMLVFVGEFLDFLEGLLLLVGELGLLSVDVPDGLVDDSFVRPCFFLGRELGLFVSHLLIN